MNTSHGANKDGKALISASSVPTYVVAEIERLNRENDAMRHKLEDIAALVDDINVRKLTILQGIVTINGIKRILKS